MDHNSNRQHHLGVNKLGKAIKKDYTTATSSASSSSSTGTATNNNGGGRSSSGSSFPAPTAARASTQQPPVYNISKSDFRAFVQQLTGAAGTSCVVAPARPPTHPDPRPAAGNRLQQVRPPPLAPIAHRPAAAVPDPARAPLPRFPADSPVSAYLRYLESSLLHSDGTRGVLNPAGSSQASSSPAVPTPASPLGFPSPSALLNLPSPSPLMLSPGTSFLHPPLSPGLFFPQSPSDLLSSPWWRDV